MLRGKAADEAWSKTALEMVIKVVHTGANATVHATAYALRGKVAGMRYDIQMYNSRGARKIEGQGTNVRPKERACMRTSQERGINRAQGIAKTVAKARVRREFARYPQN